LHDDSSIVATTTTNALANGAARVRRTGRFGTTGDSVLDIPDIFVVTQTRRNGAMGKATMDNGRHSTPDPGIGATRRERRRSCAAKPTTPPVSSLRSRQNENPLRR
jgi:hypothetical protein